MMKTLLAICGLVLCAGSVQASSYVTLEATQFVRNNNEKHIVAGLRFDVGSLAFGGRMATDSATFSENRIFAELKQSIGHGASLSALWENKFNRADQRLWLTFSQRIKL
jgi:hypothetical protein